MRPRLLIASSLIAALLARAAAARADYDAPDGCPTEEEWIRDATPPGGAAPRADVRIARDGDEHVGTLRVGDDPPREVRAPTCATVARALATIARLRASPPAPAGPPAIPSPDPPPTPTAPPAPTAPPTGAPWRLGAGLGVSVDTGIFGGPGGGLDVFGEIEAPWPATLRLGLEQSLPERGDIARATRTVARLDVCPYAARLGSLTIAPCGRLDAGFVRVEGEGVTNPRARLLGWAEAGALGRIGIRPVERLQIGLEGGGFVALFQHGVAAGATASQDLARTVGRGGLFAAVSIR